MMGRFTLRLPKTLHSELEFRAQQEGVSLNQYIVYTLTRQVAANYTIQMRPEEAIGQQKERFEKLLDSLGEASVTTTQAFLEEREDGEREEGLPDELVARLKGKLNRG